MAEPVIALTLDEAASLYDHVPHYDITAVGPLGGRCSVGWIIQPDIERALEAFCIRLEEWDDARGVEHDRSQWAIVSIIKRNCN